MREMPLDIITFIEDENLLNDRSLSDWQRTILKSTYGMALSETEMEIYKRGTGREVYDGVEQQEVTAIAGRGGAAGKPLKSLAPLLSLRHSVITASRQAKPVTSCCWLPRCRKPESLFVASATTCALLQS